MGKSPSSAEKIGVKKGPWTPEEDQKLIDFIQKYGHGKWRTLPKNAGLKRCGKSCRLRWTNYLRPDIKRGRFSFEEEETIINLHSVLGNKWSTIAANLPGRTDNEIKNYWNTHIKKKLLKMGIDPVTHTPCLDLLQLSSTLMNSSFDNNPPQLNHPDLVGMGNRVNPNLITLLAALLSSHSQNPDATHQNLQQTLIGGSPLLQNQLHNSGQYFQPYKLQIPVQENQINNEARLEQIFPLSGTNFRCQNTLPNLWQYNDGAESAMQSFSSSPSKFNNLWENQIVHNNLVSLVSSTPSSFSSPTTLNSPSSTEDVERDTYCRNMLMYNNISNGLNGSGHL